MADDKDTQHIKAQEGMGQDDACGVQTAASQPDLQKGQQPDTSSNSAPASLASEKPAPANPVPGDSDRVAEVNADADREKSRTENRAKNLANAGVDARANAGAAATEHASKQDESAGNASFSDDAYDSDYSDQEFIHPADMADHLENLSLEKQVSTLASMSKEDAADALAELDGNVAVDVLENLDTDVAAQIIAEMSPDDAADVLDELDEDHRDALLEKLTREDSDELRSLLNFDPDSAGGAMNTELILLECNQTVDEAIAHIRAEMADKDSPYYG